MGFLLSPTALKFAGIAAVIAAIWFWHHAAYEAGVKAEVAKVIAAQQKTTQELTARAAVAEHSHDAELSDLRAYRDAHPLPAVRLCESAASMPATAVISHGSRTSAAPAVIQPVPAADSPVRDQSGPDISGLLEALAARADEITAQARELQSR